MLTDLLKLVLFVHTVLKNAKRRFNSLFPQQSDDIVNDHKQGEPCEELNKFHNELKLGE